METTLLAAIGTADLTLALVWETKKADAHARAQGIAYDIGYPGIGETTLRRLAEGRDGALLVQVDPETGE
jgi:hypothetical protein